MAGSSVQLAYQIGKETTYATGVTTDKDVGVVREVQEAPTRESVVSRGVSSIQANKNVAGTEEGVHTVTLEYQHGRIFDYIFGEASHAETTGDWVHTFAVDNTPKSFTAGINQNMATDSNSIYTGCRIESAELSWSLNELFLVNYTARGKFPTNNTSALTHTQSSLDCFGNASVSVLLNGGSALAEVQSFNVSINKTINPVFGAGSNSLSTQGIEEFAVEFTITLGFDANTYDQHFVNNDLTSIDIDVLNGTALGSGKRGMELQLGSIVLKGAPKTISVGSTTYVDLTGEAKIASLVTTDNISNSNW